MTETERRELSAIRALLARGEAETALARLKEFRDTASPEFAAREMWRLHELFGAAFLLLADAAGCAQAYFAAAQSDRFLRSQREHLSAYLFALHYLPGISAEEMAAAIFGAAQVYGGAAAGAGREPLDIVVPSAVSASERDAAGKARGEASGTIRVGFLAPDFLDSAAARFYEALFDLPETFQLFAYSLSAAADDFTTWVRGRANYTVLGEADFAAAAERVAADGLDVLVDLGGHTAGGKTLSVIAELRGRLWQKEDGLHYAHPFRLASLATFPSRGRQQSVSNSLVSFPYVIEAVGWFDTTGVSGVDDFLTDVMTDGAGAAQFFSERLLRLPVAWCFTPSAVMRAAEETARTCARQTAMSGTATATDAAGTRTTRLGVFANFLKLTDEALAVWKNILARVPQATLILQDTMRAPSRVRAMEQRIAAAGLPISRVAVQLGSDDYLAELAQMDLLLDPFPYPGGALTGTALYLGAPVLTLAGARHSARIGVSLLTAAGLPELIAADEQDYEEKAVALLSKPQRLATLRENLAARVAASPLCDRTAYRAHWGEALRQIACG